MLIPKLIAGSCGVILPFRQVAAIPVFTIYHNVERWDLLEEPFFQGGALFFIKGTLGDPVVIVPEVFAVRLAFRQHFYHANPFLSPFVGEDVWFGVFARFEVGSFQQEDHVFIQVRDRQESGTVLTHDLAGGSFGLIVIAVSGDGGSEPDGTVDQLGADGVELSGGQVDLRLGDLGIFKIWRTTISSPLRLTSWMMW